MNAIIDPNYELPNISHQNILLKNIIGEGTAIIKSIHWMKAVLCFIQCIGEFGIVYQAEITSTQTGEKQTVAAKTIKGIKHCKETAYQ